MFKRLITSALVFGMAAIAPPVAAQNCAPRDVVVERLSKSFGERLSSAGLQPMRPVSVIVEIWSSAETGSFTVLFSHPNGMSCLIASGQDYFTIGEPDLPPDPAS